MEDAVTAVDLGSHAHDLSLWGLFMMADIVVKAVMLMLIGASIWSWTLIFQKKTLLAQLNRRADKFEDQFWSGEALDKIYKKVKNSTSDPLLATFSAGIEEWQDSVSGGLPARESLQVSLRQRVERAMNVTISREMGNMEQGMTFLASVGSTAPFIGLFGTVWGIMNSFSAIANTNNTSLAVVAPGIAEALFATALGLVAAIPAVIAYNVLSSGLNRYADRLEAFADEFIAILTRHMEQQDLQQSARRHASNPADNGAAKEKTSLKGLL